MSTLIQTIKTITRTFDNFTSRAGGIKMRTYQIEPAKAILKSITEKRGDTIVLIISRQAGKDELLANLLSYLVTLFSHREVGIVVANPTYKPQTINAIMRFENRLKANLLTKSAWKKRSDYMRMIGQATVSFLSGDKSANVVGAVASLLLVINEAQDISPAKYDKDFAPMVASTNATRLIVGTVWTSDTLLAREEDAARAAEKIDGIKRVFLYTSEDVRKLVPHYGQFVDSEVKKLGRQHPLVRTQYFCERIDNQAGMFNPTRRALMTGDQPAQDNPTEGRVYAITIDVGGMDEALLNLDGMGNPGRDSTTYTVSDIDLSSLEILQAPTYRAVKRDSWQGISHLEAFGKLCQIIDLWQPLYIVIDATGVGEGLWAMLAKKYGGRVIPIKFTQQTKSEMGWGYLAIIETGRFRDCCPSEIVREQYDKCQSEILAGPAKTLRWGVKDGTRGADGLLVHDDHILADSMTAELDKLQWFISSPTLMTDVLDPLIEMDRNY
jgi:hypothetical protein